MNYKYNCPYCNIVGCLGECNNYKDYKSDLNLIARIRIHRSKISIDSKEPVLIKALNLYNEAKIRIKELEEHKIEEKGYYSRNGKYYNLNDLINKFNYLVKTIYKIPKLREVLPDRRIEYYCNIKEHGNAV